MTEVVNKKYTKDVPNRVVSLFADWILPRVEEWQNNLLEQAKEYLDARASNGESIPTSKKDLSRWLDDYGIDEKYEAQLQKLFVQYIDMQIDLYNSKKISLKELKARTVWITGCL